MPHPHTLSTSDYNLTKLSTPQFAKHLDYSIAAGSNLAVISRRGTGKTQITKERIKEANYREVYINLSVFERPDLAGLPKVFNSNPKDRFVDYLLPRMYEPMLEGNQKVVILFDEADKCDDSIYAPLLELVQMHTLNALPFPNLHSCILTGNLISEGSKRIPPALLDRTEAYMLQADIGAFLDWAGHSGEIHPAIFAFLKDHPDQLCGSDELNEMCLIDPSPRSWHLASKSIRFGEEHKYDVELILEKVAGFVGKAAGSQFRAYYSQYQVLLPLVEAIFEGKDVQEEYEAMKPIDRMSVCMIVASRFATILDAANPETDKPKSIDTIGSFMKYVSPDYVVASLRAQVQSHRIRKWKLRKHLVWSKILDHINELADGK